MAKIAPSILAADFARLGEDVKDICHRGIDYLHIDVMDGSFVPNISFGAAVMKSLNDITTAPYDVHLMIWDPDRYIENFITPVTEFITVHYEACDDLAHTLSHIKEAGAKAGVSIKPGTAPEVLDGYLKDIDQILVMSVEPGFGGQKFMDSSLPKIAYYKAKREELGLDYVISVDGGVGSANAHLVRDAGVDMHCLQLWCGHSSDRMIMQVYDHVRPERDRTDETCLDSPLLKKLDGFHAESGHGAECDKYDFGILKSLIRPADQFFLCLRILLEHIKAMILEDLRIEAQRINNVSILVIICSGDGPGSYLIDLLDRRDSSCLRQFDRLHHLSQHTVRQDDDRIAVLFRDIETLINQVRALLNAGRGKYRHLHVAVIAAACDLQIICLTGLDSAYARAAAGYIQNDQRYFAGSDETDAFLHKGKSRRARGDEYSSAARGSSECHVDGSQLGLGLDKRAAGLRQLMTHIFRNFVLRRDGIAEIALDARTDRRFSKSFVPFHQDSGHVSPSSN